MENNYPLYIPSKGRSSYLTTSKALTMMGCKHNIVVEPAEVDLYRSEVKRLGLLANVIELDMAYKSKYDLLDNYGLSKSTGPGPARNFIWDHSISEGHEWHWVMDDNIVYFMRLNRNKRIRVYDGAFWKCMEYFCTRYKNVGMAGPNYVMFVPSIQKHNPFIINTRIYSCNFIRNDLPFRWRGRYNEDTILSLDMIKAGWNTVQFNTMLQQKLNTQTQKGGNTAEFYSKEGTYAKSAMQVCAHPDVSYLKYRFGRIHHYVDYTVFQNRVLVLADGCEPLSGDNEYGLELVDDIRERKDLGLIPNL